MMPKLLEVAPNAVYVIVTNPCDVLTSSLTRGRGCRIPDLRLGHRLDTSRLRWKIAQRAGVATPSVHAWIVGEHGDTEFPLWSTATIGSVPITEFTLPTVPVSTRGNWMPSPSTCATRPTR